MKELTIEEKAKAYDEAIDRAKDFMNGEVYYELKIGENIMCWIFPELRESEDERIRTFLHHTFTAQYLCKDKLGKWHGEPVVNILAWLEKQGEQNLANSAKTCKDGQNHAWSEDDEKLFKSALWHIKNSCGNGGKNSGEFEVYNWLKSLKDRYTWKPSDEQMIELRRVISGCSYDIEPLVEIEKQLKKLREE